MKKYKINSKGRELIKMVLGFYNMADMLGVYVDDDMTEDDSLAGIANTLNSFAELGFEDSITEDEFDKHIGGNFNDCLPYLEEITY